MIVEVAKGVKKKSTKLQTKQTTTTKMEYKHCCGNKASHLSFVEQTSCCCDILKLSLKLENILKFL